MDWFVGLFGGGNNNASGIDTDAAQDFFNNFNTDIFQFDNAQ